MNSPLQLFNFYFNTGSPRPVLIFAVPATHHRVIEPGFDNKKLLQDQGQDGEL